MTSDKTWMNRIKNTKISPAKDLPALPNGKVMEICGPGEILVYDGDRRVAYIGYSMLEVLEREKER